jgi:hypothetical protein
LFSTISSVSNNNDNEQRKKKKEQEQEEEEDKQTKSKQSLKKKGLRRSEKIDKPSGLRNELMKIKSVRNTSQCGRISL